MAKNKSLANCINLHASPSTKEALLKNLEASIKNNDTTAVVLHLENKVELLQDIINDADNQRDKLTKEFKENSYSNSYINKPNDSFNELTTFQTTKALFNNLINLAGSFSKALVDKYFNRNEINTLEQDVLQDFNKTFHQKGLKSLLELFSYKEKSSNFQGRIEDPMQYLPQRKKIREKDSKGKFKDQWVIEPFKFTDDEGNPLLNSKNEPIVSDLDPLVTSAILSTAYEFLGSDIPRLTSGQTLQSIKQLLGLDKDEMVPYYALDHLSDVGVKLESLAANMGRIIVERLAIQSTNESGHLIQKRLEMSLGFMAINVLQDLGYVERQYVYTGEFSENISSVRKQQLIKEGFVENEFGFAGILADKKLDSSKVIHKEGETREGLVAAKFIKIRGITKDEITGELNFSPEIEKIIEKVGVAENAFDKFFGNTPRVPRLSWNKIKGKVEKIGSLRASERHSDNHQRYKDIPYEENSPTLNLFKELLDKYDNGEESAIKSLNQILGMQSMEGKLKIRKKNVEGTNRTILNSLRDVRSYFTNKLNSKDIDTSGFFIDGKFQANARMRQEGLLEPQNDKIIRSLFNPKGFKVSFDPTTDEYLHQKFMQAIAESFDIEELKTGGPEGQLKNLRLLINPSPSEIRKAAKESKDTGKPNKQKMVLQALRALQSYDQGGTLTKVRAEHIAAATEALGLKLHSLQGLVELSRFMNHKEGEFTTTIPMEKDGVTNGLILGLLQFLPSKMNAVSKLSLLSMGGIQTNTNPEKRNLSKLKEYLSDAYERMGQSWAEEIINLYEEFKSKKNQQRINQMRAISNLLGDVTDKNGIIHKKIRSISKDRTMQINYGAGVRKQVNIFTYTNVINEGIYDRLETIIANNDIDSLEDLFNDINQIAGANLNINQYLLDRDTLDLDKLLSFELSKKQIQTIETTVFETYGKAMKGAIETIFGPMIEMRKPFNSSVQVLATMYNAILKAKIEAKLIENKNINRVEKITKAEVAAIVKEMESILPKIKTPYHTKDNPSYLALVVAGNKFSVRQFADSATVTQIYGKKGVTRLLAEVEGIPFLDPVKASPIVKAIQMMDATIANNMMGTPGLHFINVHDGFIHPIDKADVVTEQLNGYLKEMTENYNMAEAFYEMYQQIGTEASALLDEYKIDRAKLLEDLVKNKVVKNSDKSFKEVGKELQSTLLKNSTEATKNKTELVKVITEYAQYPNDGNGVVVENPDTTTTTIFGINRDNINTADKRNTEIIQRRTKRDNSNDFSFRSHDDNVSTNPDDYNNVSTKVDKLNVTEVYNELNDLDKDSQYQGKVDSDQHKDHLKRILNDIVSKVMTPIEFFRAQHQVNDKETMGMFTGDNKVWIQTQRLSTQPPSGLLAHKIRMSTGEVYTHELIHKITHHALKTNTNLRNQVYNLYEVAHDQLMKKYNGNGFISLLADPSIPLDQQDQFEVEAAKERWDYIFNQKTDPKKPHKMLDEFLSFGLTNESFVNELSQITIPDKTIKARRDLNKVWDKNLQTTLINIFNVMMDFIQQKIHHQKHSTRMDKELENLVLALGEAESRSKSIVYRSIMRAESQLTDLSLLVDQKIKDHLYPNPDISKPGKGLHLADKIGIIKAVNTLKQFPELDNPLSYQMRVAMHWYNNKEASLLNAIVTEAKGNTDRLMNLHEVLTQSRLIDTAKVTQSQVIKDRIGTWFKRKLSSPEKTAITKVILKGDMSYLMDRVSYPTMINMLRKDSEIDFKINFIKQQMDKNGAMQPFSQYFENMADDLGFFMIHSAAREGTSPLMNGQVIAQMKGLKSEGALTGKVFDDAVNHIEQLASLFAMKYASKNDRRMVADLMEENLDSIKKVMSQHKSLKKDSLRQNFNNNPALMQKGYVRTILNSRIEIKTALMSERKYLEDNGYILQTDKPIPRDTKADLVQDDIYMFVSKTGMINSYQSGIMAMIRNSARGVDMFDVEGQIGTAEGIGAAVRKNEAHAIGIVKERLENAFKKRPASFYNKVPKENVLIPKTDDQGNIMGVRYIMNEHTKDNLLEQFSDFDAVFGNMVSTIIEKAHAPEINRELISALKELSDDDQFGIAAMPEAYVEISPHSEVERYRDIYRMIPDDAKEEIAAQFGEGILYVPRDVVDLAFGQRKYTMLEMFGKNPKERKLFETIIVEGLTFAMGWENPLKKNQSATSFKGRAAIRVRRMEEYLAQTTRIAKSNIVVRNMKVIHGNYMSNLSYLKSKGITLEKIQEYNREAISGMATYQQDMYKLNILKGDRELIADDHSLTVTDRESKLKVLDRKITRLEHTIALNPTSDMMGKGFIPQVVDDVFMEGVDVPDPHKHGLELLLDNTIDKLPGKTKGIAKVMFMTEDTQGFKILNNAVRMTDYIGRFALYKHYISKGMSEIEAKNKAKDEFINFDIPSHRLLEYGNTIGFLWFTKFGIRIIKHIKNIVKDQPFTALVTFMLGSILRADNIIGSMPGITKQLLAPFGNAPGTLGDSVGQIFTIDMADTVTSPLR